MFVSGGYTVTYNAVSLGQLFEGFTFQHTAHKEIITGDNIARAAQDAVFQGIDVTSDFTLGEWSRTTLLPVFWPYGAAWLTAGVVGRLDVGSGLVKQLVLTAIAGTPAAIADGTQVLTLTLPRSIIHEDFPVQTIMRPAHRRVPLRMRHYPALAIPNDPTSVIYGTLT